MAKEIKIEADALYKVNVEHRFEVAGLELRPGTEAILIGSAVLEAGENVTVKAKVEA